jgi:predicted RNase H-like nuclease (RuvC/YqgF family)
LKILSSRLQEEFKYVEGKLANCKHELKEKTNLLQQLQKKLLKTEHLQSRDTASDNEAIAALTLKSEKQSEEIAKLEAQIVEYKSNHMTGTILSGSSTLQPKQEDKREDNRHWEVQQLQYRSNP